jgi:phosphomannomutase/phosphoglucomutase
VVLRFEGDTPEALSRIQNEFRTAIDALLPGCKLPF